MMRLDEKARENLDAAGRLLAPADDTVLPLFNASASRAYYAAYQAIADRAQRASIPFDSTRADYYRHDQLPTSARQWQIIDDDLSDDLVLLYGLRIKADYMQDQVDIDEANTAGEAARRLVEHLVGLE